MRNPDADLPALSDWIREQIRQQGPIPFSRFMDWALYHPTWGYYTRGPRIGERGDFVTSPEASPAFGLLLARHVLDIDALIGAEGELSLIECGPGLGTLALHLLDNVAEGAPALYERLTYTLVEVSPALAAAQRELLTPRHAGKVGWVRDLADLGPGLRGAVLANEVIDAFPVHILGMTPSGMAELYVENELAGGFKFEEGEPSDPQLLDFIERYGIELEPGERIEVNLSMGEWARQAARALGRGVVTVVDYGDTQPGRYSAARRMGTLLGYFGGAVTASVLERPGLQDLTALVDFTALRDELVAAGFREVGLTRQANFLVGLGLGTVVAMTGNETELDRALTFRRGAQALLSPEGLGSFHVLVAALGIEPAEARQALSGLRYA